MSTTFTKSPKFVFTSESVSAGHPDKLCDQVSDAILDAFLDHDPRARVAVETATTTGLIVVLGEVTYAKGYIPIEERSSARRSKISATPTPALALTPIPAACWWLSTASRLTSPRVSIRRLRYAAAG